MKKIKLTKGKFAKVDNADYKYLNQFKWQAHPAGEKLNYWYARRAIGYYIDGKRRQRYITMHREILGLTDRKLCCDHIDHDTLNNQRSNLRVCSNKQNLCNSRKSRYKKTSKFKGVSYFKITNKWVSHLQGKHIGYYKTEEAAARAYDEKAKQVFGEFANLNNV